MKLNYNDINYIISESTKRILSEAYRDSYGRMWDRGGRIPRDGMTGGSWGSSKIFGKYWVDVQELVELLDEETYTTDLHNKLENIERDLYFNVTANYGYDDTVGIPEGIDDITVDTTPCVKAISNLSLFTGAEIHVLKNAIEMIAENVEDGDGDNIQWND